MEQAEPALTLVLADDHHVVRRGLRSLLESALRCSVVGEASEGREAVALVERLRPDVLVVDMVMPGLPGAEVIRQAHTLAPGTHIVVLSMHADESHVREALRAGATAYVLKEALPDEFLRVVREAAVRRHLSPRSPSDRSRPTSRGSVRRPSTSTTRSTRANARCSA